jgi:hypothetical protein
MPSPVVNRTRPLRLGLGQGGAGRLNGVVQCVLMVLGPPATMIVIRLHKALQLGAVVSAHDAVGVENKSRRSWVSLPGTRCQLLTVPHT